MNDSSLEQKQVRNIEIILLNRRHHFSILSISTFQSLVTRTEDSFFCTTACREKKCSRKLVFHLCTTTNKKNVVDDTIDLLFGVWVKIEIDFISMQ
ncbi:unnamed protein product [Amoebophrya sp. A25]|nr:unnamed protein product [Amoebophrya sp. A25]|eukprot:GSA25T00001615001.1